MSYKIGILDQSPIFPKETAYEALQHTIELAKAAEEWGYHRFWVSEHHNMVNVAGSSPEILISYLLAQTEKINIGSGGVMLQHYSPYKVAENFNVMSTLAPGRVDLGIGRAPGGFDLTTRALQYGHGKTAVDFNEKITFLKQIIDQSIREDHPFAHLRATPEPHVKPGMYFLGGSAHSARFAAELEIDFVFARFLNNKDEDLLEAATVFKEQHPEGKFIVAVTVLATESELEAARLAEELKLYQVTYSDGRTSIVQAYDQVLALKEQVEEPIEVKEKPTSPVIGTAHDIKQTLDQLYEKYYIDEFIFHTPLLEKEIRFKSFERLSPQKLFF